MGQPKGVIHFHLCPECKVAFKCLGAQCGAYNGVPHQGCAPKSKFARMTKEVK